jgi:hypothetical protein
MKITFEIDAVPGEIELIDGLLDDMVEGVCAALRQWRKHVSFETAVGPPGRDEYHVKVLGVDAVEEKGT